MTSRDRDIFTELSTIAERRHRVARRAQSEQLVVCFRVICRGLLRGAGFIADMLRRAASGGISW